MSRKWGLAPSMIGMAVVTRLPTVPVPFFGRCGLLNHVERLLGETSRCPRPLAAARPRFENLGYPPPSGAPLRFAPATHKLIRHGLLAIHHQFIIPQNSSR